MSLRRRIMYPLVMAALCTPAFASSGPGRATAKQAAPPQTNTAPAKVVADASIKGLYCNTDTLYLGKLDEGRYKDAGFIIPAGHGFFGMLAPDPKELSAGEYTVIKATCIQGKKIFSLPGPHAKFTVKAGEVINLGYLELQYQPDSLIGTAGTLRKSVGAMRLEMTEKLRERHADVMAKAVYRPLTIVGPTETRIR